MKEGNPMQSVKRQLSLKLKTLPYQNKSIVIGFDGFIDEIIHAVDKRLDSEHFTRIETMLQFAKRIEKASGLSTNIELFPVQEKIGGNGPIMCNALSQHESKITYLGALGVPQIHPVFSKMPANVKLYSVANSGHTDAIEFLDGKLMLGKMSSLNDVTYENLVQAVGEEQLIDLLNNVDLFAAVNWSMIPHMTDLWIKLRTNIVPKLNKRDIKPIFFVDLADPEKREHDEIKSALDHLKSFNPWFNVVLGLNKKEAYDVARVLHLIDHDVTLEDLNTRLYQYLDIYGVVIHPVDQSCCIIGDRFEHEFGPLAQKPKLTTGAGDNFNAGFVFGLLLGLKPNEALLLGMATSGFYVRQARSPKYSELIDFLIQWDDQILD